MKFASGFTTFHELRIQNGRVYKDLKVPLDGQGIVTILGKNGCLSGDTEVYYNYKGRESRTTLKNLYESIERGKPHHTHYTRSFTGSMIELHQVLDVVYSGKKECLEIKLDNGLKLRGTPDHRVLTRAGWAEFRELLGKEVATEKVHPQTDIKFQKVISVEEFGELDTYDIQCLPPHHNFVANGIVVHNSGKSTLWALFEAAIFSVTPEGDRKDDLLQVTGDASIEIDLSKGGKNYTIKHRRVKGKWTHEIFENGGDIDLAAHSSVDAAQDVQELMGLTQEEFEGSVHLTQNSQHILISGKPAMRKSYISDFFGLDHRFDAVLQKAKSQLSIIQDQIQKVSSLEYTRGAVWQELGDLPVLDERPLQAEIQQLQSKQTSLAKEIQSLQSLKTQWSSYDLMSAQALQHPEAEANLPRLEAEVISAKTRLQQSQTVREQNTKHKKILESRQAILSRIQELYRNFPDVDLYLDGPLEQEFQTLKARINLHKQYEPMRQELKTLSDLPDVLADVSPIKAEILSHQKASHSLEERLRALSSGMCPTCGASYDKLSLEESQVALQDVRLKLSHLEPELKRLETQNQWIKRKLELERFLEKTPTVQDFEVARCRDLESALPYVRDLVSLNQQLQGYPSVEILPEVDVDFLLRELPEKEALLSSYRKAVQARASLPPVPAMTKPDIETNLDFSSRLYQEISQKLSSLAQEIGKVRAMVERKTRLESQLTQLDKELGLLPELKKAEFFWSKMVEAYGPRGIRVQQLDKIMSLIMKRLPYYAGILFTDKSMRFTHECDAGNISILVTRKILTTKVSKGKVEHAPEEITHDVSSLSGGEKKRLSIALVLTLADCISSLKRTNILILDETDSSLDAEGQYLFVNELLPVLKQKYSSIFVISHADEIKQAAIFDQVWRIQKDQNWSTISFERAN